jgi:hypothetical protein
MDAASYQLVGWIRLITGDCLGIPVFTNGSNTEFIPETDNSLRIVAFHPFYNEEHYAIDRSLRAELREINYCIGQGVPIPFSIQGVTYMADSQRPASDFRTQLAGQIHDLTVQAVAKILEDVATGAFYQMHTARTGKKFEESYPEIFREAPTHSRHWIEQFKRAATELELVGKEEQIPLRQKLASRASEWLQRYMSSGDQNTLDIFLTATERVGYGAGKPVYYGLACHLLASRPHRFIGSTCMIQVMKRIPEGLYYYELTANVIFINTNFDLLQCMQSAMVDGEFNLDFSSSFELAKLLFGDQKLPPDIDTLAGRIVSSLVYRIEVEVRHFDDDLLPGSSEHIIKTAGALRTLRHILDWNRKSVPKNISLGLSRKATHLIKSLE